MVQQLETDVYYPDSDGQPMGETDRHRDLLFALVFALTQHFAPHPDVYVTGNLFIYYVRGDPNKNISPDVCVVFGSPQRPRNTYQVWRDGPFPQMVIELASASTRTRDLGPKRAVYEGLGVLEYYIFDPHAEAEETTAPTAAGELHYYQRASAEMPWGPRRRARGETPVYSGLLGLGLSVRGQDLRFVDETTGALLPTPAEEAAGRRQEAAARRHEAAGRRREAAARRREAAARQAAEARAQALAEEVARLRARLDQDGDA
ncbi:MAG TPA: Uma2 family endonuclease [Ktedonobacterales bacterium]|jgi:Uma2 family endonuclease